VPWRIRHASIRPGLAPAVSCLPDRAAVDLVLLGELPD
jgi:hypothetical protein